MKTRLVILVFFTIFCYGALFAQISPDGAKLPTVIPVSPEAAALGKYGEIPINLASGKINYQIPIYTIKVKGFEWPIYLSYNYNGLKLSEEASMTGLGWNLIASGRVTRQVRGAPDELSVGNFKTNRVLPYLDGTLEDSYNNNQITLQQFKDEKYYIYDKILNAHWDAQQDMYHINAGNVSGTFMYTFNNVLFFTNHKNYKVEKVPDENGSSANLHFAVTDTKGVKYYFKTHELGEYKISRSSGLVDVEARVPISYLLTKIKLPNNAGEINFEYESSQVNNDSYKKVYTVATGITNYSKQEYRLTVNRPLKKIIFPSGEVRFSTSKYTSGSGNTRHVNYALDSISVWRNTKRVSQHSFFYDNATKNRKLLNSIKRTTLNETLNWYSFNYYTPTSDLIDYSARDDWGYYNGKPGVSGLLAADKPISLEHTRKGALRTINYPTGGSTTINYEQNEVPRVHSSSACTTYKHNKTIKKRYEVNYPSQQTSISINETINVSPNQKIKVKTNSQILGSSSGASLNLFITTTTNSASSGCSSAINMQVTNIQNTDYNNENKVSQEQFRFTNNGQITIAGSISANTGSHVYCDIEIEYEDKTVLNTPVGGIRVASTIDYDGKGNSYTSNYKYNDASGISSGKLTDKDHLPKQYSVSGSPTTHLNTGNKTITTASSADSFTGYQGSPVLYNRVETIKDAGLSGKQVDYFSFSGYYNNASIHYYRNSTDAHSFPFVQDPYSTWEDGRLWKKEIFKSTGTGYELQELHTSTYQDIWTYGNIFHQLPIKAYGLAVGRNSWRWNVNGANASLIEGDPNDYKDTKYLNSSKSSRLIKQTKTLYFNGTPSTTETTYAYDTPYNQITSSTNTTSTNKEIKSKFFYPYNITNSINTALISQNRIATLIKTETYQKKGTNPEELLSTQRTNYKDWDLDLGLPADTNIILPEHIQTSKRSTALESRITYHSYDDKSNPIEVSKADGTSIVYVWGYSKQYPIAKIENATFTSGKPNTITSTQQVLINNAVAATVNETTEATENTLRAKLQLLRVGFPNAMVTSYTYDPLVGVTSITDPKGYRMDYEYDAFNRLEFVKDANGNLISENKYNYKN